MAKKEEAAKKVREAQELQSKKRVRAESESDGGEMVVGQIVVKDGVTWKAVEGRTCNPCGKAGRRCLWRDHKRAKACFSCYSSKKPCDVGDGSDRAGMGPSKKKKLAEKEKERLVEKPVAGTSGNIAGSELGSGSEIILEKILAEIKGMREDMRHGINAVANELKEIRRTEWRIVSDLVDLTNHFIPEEEEEAEEGAEMAEQTLE